MDCFISTLSLLRENHCLTSKSAWIYCVSILFYKIHFFMLAWPISCKDLINQIPASADLIILNFVSVGANFDFGTISLLVLLLLARPVSGHL